MKSTIISFFTLGLALGFLPSASKAQPAPNPPGQISYQGFLTDANGFPLATNNPVNYNVQFRIWNASTGGTNLWGELQVVTVDRGYFTVMLGNGSSLPGVTFTNNLAGIFSGSDASDRYLEITVQGLAPGDPPIAPRLRLLASPYSYLASRSLVAVSALSVDASTAIADANLSPNVALRNATQNFTGVNTFSNSVRISAGNTLEFGAGTAGKEANAGKIGYQTFSSALDIVGAGTNSSSRMIQFWAEGGANFTGGATIGGNVGIGTTTPAATLDVRGDVKMQGGAGGNTVFATGSQEDLRIVRGVVNYDGTIISGSGFTVGHGSTGAYVIQFNQSFSDRPAVTVTLGRNSSNTFTPLFPIYYGVSPTEVDLYLLNSNGSFVTDVSFHFIAVGAR
jgi:hypothetical protein